MRSTTNPSDDAAPESKCADAFPDPRWHWLRAHKPAASSPWHLLLAAVMWSAVGTFLVTLGVRWLVHADAAVAWPVMAVAIGILKARFVLRRSARRIIDRIRERGDGRCLGGFLSPKSWLLVLFMMAAGRLLRFSPLPLRILGAIYLMIGSALFLSSLYFWNAWRKQRRPAEC
jgi:hypothetical protein